MRMCEYANNIVDMILLEYITDKSREIEYKNRKTYLNTLMDVNQIYDISGMVFPRMYRDFHYIELYKRYNGITFDTTIFVESALHELGVKYVGIYIEYD
jgi:hypothetical protein